MSSHIFNLFEFESFAVKKNNQTVLVITYKKIFSLRVSRDNLKVFENIPKSYGSPKLKDAYLLKSYSFCCFVFLYCGSSVGQYPNV